MQLIFNSSGCFQTQDLYNIIDYFMNINPVVKVKFVKVSGEVREMNCTRHAQYVPAAEYKSLISNKNSNTDLVLVWSLDQNSWRQFKTDKVLSIESTEWNSEKPREWVLDVVEDSETGDLMLEFPEDMLSQTGWKSGDTLEWTMNPDGSWLLSKAE